jgi:hypothetical protein
MTTAKLVHHFAPETGEFLVSSSADESPLEPGVVIIPANATIMQPPSVSPGEVAVFRSDGWEIVEDHRGITCWLQDGSQHIITSIGPPPEGSVLLRPPSTPEQIIVSFTAAIQQQLDDFARTRGYDSILSACTYAASAVPKFQAEGAYCVSVRDATWAAAGALLAEHTDAVMLPTLDVVLAAMPALAWPA